MADRITLVTPYFSAGDKQRQEELDECLRLNIANENIDQILLLIDDGHRPPYAADNVVVIDIPSRPTYADWLRISLERSVQGVCVLANSDIYFDETISNFPKILKGSSTLVALSRWEVESGSLRAHPNPEWSQDVWAVSMHSSFSPDLMQRLEFELGVPRCDNKAAYVFATQGWGVRNPYQQIKSMHLHESGLRTYRKRGDYRLLGGVAYVYPSDGLDKDSRLHIDVWSLKSHNVVDVSFNSNIEKWKAEDDLIRSAEEVDNVEASRQLKQKTSILKNGFKRFSIAAEYAVYVHDGHALLVVGNDPGNWIVLDEASIEDPAMLLRALIRPVLVSIPEIKEAGEGPDDVNFWQYPCWTEKQAYENHLRMQPGRNVDSEKKIVRVYLPLPWATLIDKKTMPQELVKLVSRKIQLARDLSESYGYTLDVHTVCQHIHWRRLVEDMIGMGIDALSISHCERTTMKEIREEGRDIRIRPWTLYAVNFANKSRSKGLEPGKPINQRRYLASFIGAYMPHYRSDIRVKLFEALSILAREDVIVDLGKMWHFNKIVYNEQVANDPLAEQDVQTEQDATVRYNQVLTDSKFALCPDGAGPNTLRFWEAIAAGSIPILFDKKLQFPWSVEADLYENCLFWEKQDFGEDFCNWLASFSDSELQDKSERLRKIYQTVELMTSF